MDWTLITTIVGGIAGNLTIAGTVIRYFRRRVIGEERQASRLAQLETDVAGLRREHKEWECEFRSETAKAFRSLDRQFAHLDRAVADLTVAMTKHAEHNRMMEGWVKRIQKNMDRDRSLPEED